MAPWKPVDIDPINRNKIGEDDDKWGDDLMNALERRFNRQFNATLETSSDKDITLNRDKLKKKYDRIGFKSNIR